MVIGWAGSAAAIRRHDYENREGNRQQNKQYCEIARNPHVGQSLRGYPAFYKPREGNDTEKEAHTRFRRTTSPSQ